MLTYVDLHWSSDWNGYEVGFPEVDVVGLYSLKINPKISFYIDIFNEKILCAWYDNDCECCEEYI